MFNERAFISQVERANPEELANLLIRPSLQEERALRAHLGDERYQRMHSMALKRKVTRGTEATRKGNVVVIHGIMGAELSVSSGGPGDLTWVNAIRILRGWLDRLRLSDDGRSDANPKFTVTATGIMKHLSWIHASVSRSLSKVGTNLCFQMFPFNRKIIIRRS